MLEVVGGIAMHPQALHQPQGVLVGRYGESHHLVQAKGIEGVAQRRLGRLVGEALRPMLGGETPADGHRGTKGASKSTTSSPT